MLGREDKRLERGGETAKELPEYLLNCQPYT